MFSVLCVNMNTNRLKVSDKYNLNLQLTKGFFGVQDTVLFEDSPSECLSKMSLSKKTHSNLNKNVLPLHSLTHDRRFRQAGFSEASGRVSRQHSGPAPAAHWTAPLQTLRTHSHGFTTLSVGNSAESDRGIWTNGAVHSLTSPKSPLLFRATQRILPI